MEIKFFGSRAVLLKGKKEGVLVDPTSNLTGNGQTRSVIFTDPSGDFLGLGTDKVVIKGPGEYEIGGVEINGLDRFWMVNIDGVLVGILGQGADEKVVDGVDGVDVLIADVKIESKVIVAIAKKLGVNYLVPINFDGKDENLVKLLDQVDEEELEFSDELRVDKDNLPEGMEVVLLKKSD